MRAPKTVRQAAVISQLQGFVEAHDWRGVMVLEEEESASGMAHELCSSIPLDAVKIYVSLAMCCLAQHQEERASQLCLLANNVMEDISDAELARNSDSVEELQRLASMFAIQLTNKQSASALRSTTFTDLHGVRERLYLNVLNSSPEKDPFKPIGTILSQAIGGANSGKDQVGADLVEVHLPHLAENAERGGPLLASPPPSAQRKEDTAAMRPIEAHASAGSTARFDLRLGRKQTFSTCFGKAGCAT